MNIITPIPSKALNLKRTACILLCFYSMIDTMAHLKPVILTILTKFLILIF